MAAILCGGGQNDAISRSGTLPPLFLYNICNITAGGLPSSRRRRRIYYTKFKFIFGWILFTFFFRSNKKAKILKSSGVVVDFYLELLLAWKPEVPTNC